MKVKFNLSRHLKLRMVPFMVGFSRRVLYSVSCFGIWVYHEHVSRLALKRILINKMMLKNISKVEGSWLQVINVSNQSSDWRD